MDGAKLEQTTINQQVSGLRNIYFKLSDV